MPSFVTLKGDLFCKETDFVKNEFNMYEVKGKLQYKYSPRLRGL